MSPVPLATERTQELAEELLNDALELSAHERAEFVRLQCGDDQSLRDEVLAMLADYERMPTGFLEEPLIPRIVQLPPKADEFTDLTEQQLGRYEMRRLLGQGGMGQVWLAHDTKLNNDVAIKVLPYQFSCDANRLQRFQSEAQSILTLKHQNIVFLYDIDQVTTEQGELHYFVMELIEGQTLRQRLKDEGRLPWRTAVDIASQIAAALEAAHHKGVIHRDIKPENVMLCPDGFVKVLDFGLAKFTGNPLTDASLTQSGTVIGTLRYMSPEQARGQKVTTQTDIFSLGTVLYELLTGQPLFAGDNYADVSAAILSYEPPLLRESVPDAPPVLERTIHRALAKDIRDRYQSVHDLQLDLQKLRQELELQGHSGSVGQISSGSQASLKATNFKRWMMGRAWLLVALTLLLVGAVWWVKFRPSGKVEVPLLGTLKTVPVHQWASAPGEVYSEGKLSPDKKWVAFTRIAGGSRNIWTKQIADGDVKPKATTEDNFINDQPLWSSNSDEIAYLSRRGDQWGIWRIAMSGGTPVLLKPLREENLGVTLRFWSREGVIFYQTRSNLFAFTIRTGQTEQLTQFDANKTDNKYFCPSPDKRSIAYLASVAEGRTEMWVTPMRGGQPRKIARLPATARNLAWHPDSQRFFFSAKENGIFQVFVGDLAGHPPIQLTTGEANCLVTDVSSDGDWVLYGSSNEASDIWGVDRLKKQEFAVAADFNAKFWPDVSRDHRAIVYQSVVGLSQGNKITSDSTIVTKLLSSAAEPTRLATNGYLPQWSPDGKYLAFMRKVNNLNNLWVMASEGGIEHQLTQEGCLGIQYSVMPYNRMQASDYAWSPDGSTLAYLAEINRRGELRAVKFDGSSDRQLSTTDDSSWRIACPLWSADGKRIAWTARMEKLSSEGKYGYGVWVTDLETQTARLIYRTDDIYLRLVGWSWADESLLLASCAEKNISKPATVKLSRLSLTTKSLRSIDELRLAYFWNIYLSPDRRFLAYVVREDEKDNLWIRSMRGDGASYTLTANHAPHLVFSSLAWAHNSQTLYFGKQSRYSSLSMLANFK